MKRFTLFILLIILQASTILPQIKPPAPRLAIIFVIDQFAHHYFEKITPHLSGGIDFLLKNGVVYNNAYMPHAHPATGPGHVALNTGTYARNHGIVANRWAEKKLHVSNFEEKDVDKNHVVFSPTGLYDYVKSAQNIMVDGLSDQFVLHSKPNRTYKAVSFSHKSRAAIGTAGKLGKAIWFDQEGRQFTSSKAYFDKMPGWLTSFNKQYSVSMIPQKIVWKRFHKNNLEPYNFYETKNYTYAKHNFGLVGRNFSSIKPATKMQGYEELYIKTPHASQHLLDLARAYLDTNFRGEENLLMWICISPLDPLGHYYGPYSQEALDLIYHIDWQIGEFMEYVNKKVNPKEVLFCLTADHGVMPIVEILQDKGIKNAYRINEKETIEKLNNEINKKHKIANLVTHFNTPQFYVDKEVFAKLSKQQRKNVSKTAKAFLKNVPGISNVWTYKELQKISVPPGSIEEWYKNQTYPGRSGEFICKFSPYSAITKHKKGTHHRTPYEYDTHVPLMLYQKDAIKNKVIDEKVLSIQLASTLAKLFNIARPSASRVETLPL